MNKLAAIWGLFRQGQAVADPQLWKKRQITATVLAGLILAIVNVAAAFGYPLPIDMETANAIAGGIIGIVNVILTITTTNKIGIPSANPVVIEQNITEEQPVVQNTENVQQENDYENKEMYGGG